jgi:hypothetical protein
MKKLCFLLAATLGLGLPSLAQDNVIKVGLLSLTGRNVTFGYERVIRDNQSVVLNGGFIIPWNNPLSLTTRVEGVSSFRVRGFNLTPEYRFYLGQRPEAPEGFYLAPFLRYYQISGRAEYQDTYDGVEVSGTVSSRYSTAGLGGQLGYQWVINDALTIDWYFLGLGVYLYRLGFETTISDLQGTPLDTVRERVDEQLDEVPLLGDLINLDAEGRSLSGSVSVPFLGLRTGLALGYRF